MRSAIKLRSNEGMICSMDEELIKKVRSELARQGGLARTKALTPQQRRESAIKVSKAAAKALNPVRKDCRQFREVTQRVKNKEGNQIDT